MLVAVCVVVHPGVGAARPSARACVARTGGQAGRWAGGWGGQRAPCVAVSGPHPRFRPLGHRQVLDTARILQDRICGLAPLASDGPHVQGSNLTRPVDLENVSRSRDDSSQIMPNSANLGVKSTRFGRTLPNLECFRPVGDSDHMRANLAKSRVNSNRRCRLSSCEFC